MLLRPSERLDEVLTQLLGEHGSLDAKQLQELASKRFRPCSIQGIYHELRKLQSLGAVLKVKQQYQLSISWASEIVLFAEQVYENCISGASAKAILPEEGEKSTWQFSNLLRMDDFWVQIMQTLYHETACPHFFGWNPYPWYFFAQPKKVMEYYNYVLREKRRFYYILGGEDFLTRLYVKSVSPEIFSYSFADPPFKAKMNVHINVAPPYVLSIHIDADTFGRIESLFEDVTSERQMTYTRIDRALNQPARLKVQLEHNVKKAMRLEKKFRSFFGVRG